MLRSICLASATIGVCSLALSGCAAPKTPEPIASSPEPEVAPEPPEAEVLPPACTPTKWSQFDKSVAPSKKPPLPVKQVPMFVAFGWDDNGHADGLAWAGQLFDGRSNPDNTPARATFYLTANYGASPEVQAQWQALAKAGHEIGNHSLTHTTNTSTTRETWDSEISQADIAIQQVTGRSCTELPGFRTPFLEHNRYTFEAVAARGFRYDCSMEEGFQDEQDGRNFVWPYTLDHPSPGNTAIENEDAPEQVGSYPGLWEMPVYAWMVPPDTLAKKYGFAKGLRKRMRQADPAFDIAQGKVTGFDYNLWYIYHVDKDEALAIFKYSFDQRMAGNRAPMLFGVHSDEYSELAAQEDAESEANVKATWQQRREAIEAFLDYAASHQETRIVSVNTVVDWLEAPTPIAKLARK